MNKLDGRNWTDRKSDRAIEKFFEGEQMGILDDLIAGKTTVEKLRGKISDGKEEISETSSGKISMSLIDVPKEIFEAAKEGARVEYRDATDSSKWDVLNQVCEAQEDRPPSATMYPENICPECGDSEFWTAGYGRDRMCMNCKPAPMESLMVEVFCFDEWNRRWNREIRENSEWWVAERD